MAELDPDHLRLFAVEPEEPVVVPCYLLELTDRLHDAGHVGLSLALVAQHRKLERLTAVAETILATWEPAGYSSLSRRGSWLDAALDPPDPW